MSKAVLLADDHEIFLVGIQNILEKNLDIEVNGQFPNGNALMEYLEEGGHADLIIFDVKLSLPNGQEVNTYLNKEFPETKKLAIIHRESEAKKDDAYIPAEIDGFIYSDCSTETLLKCVVEILKGNKFFQEHPIKTQLVSRDFYRQIEKEYELTQREIDILKLILHQYENGEIAKKLNLSPLTIKTHRRNIFKKLKVRNLAGMVWLIKDHKEMHRIF